MSGGKLRLPFLHRPETYPELPFQEAEAVQPPPASTACAVSAGPFGARAYGVRHAWPAQDSGSGRIARCISRDALLASACFCLAARHVRSGSSWMSVA
eukprot:3637537-Rhodomonas_salina.1